MGVAKVQKATALLTPVVTTHAPKDVLSLKQLVGRKTVKTGRSKCHSQTLAGDTVDSEVIS